MATHSSILAWKTPWTEEPGRLQSMGSQRLGYNGATKQSHTNKTNKKTNSMGCSRNKQKNSVGCSRSGSKKELYSNTSISRKQQTQTTNLTLYIKE